MKMLSCWGFGFLGYALVLWIADGLLCSVVCVTQNWPQPQDTERRMNGWRRKAYVIDGRSVCRDSIW